LVLKLARDLKVMKVGTVSIDGTKIKAHASLHKSIRYDRAVELEKELDLKVQELMDKAREEKENKGKGGGGKRLKTSPPEESESKAQSNMTDPDSRIMKKNTRSEYTQAYNAQAVVDADGSMLVLGCYVTNNSTDRGELAQGVEAIPEELGKPMVVLADKGNASQDPVETVQEEGIEVLVSVQSEQSHQKRRFDFRPRPQPLVKKDPKQQKIWVKKMAAAMETERARGLYKKRKSTVEPVFGIVKQVLGFRQFLLRGLGKVNLEWSLVMCAYNLKRLAVLNR